MAESKEKHLLLLGGSTEIYKTAKEYNFKVTLVQEKAWMEIQDYELVDRVIHAPIDAKYIPKIAEILHEDCPFDVVISFLEDGLLNAGIIQQTLRIEGNPYYPVYITKNKHKMREVLKEHDELHVPFKTINTMDDLQLFSQKVGFPIVIKSTTGTGSRKIFKLDNLNDATTSIEEIRSEYPQSEIIAEKFISGHEVSVEAISLNGVHKIVAITDKTTSGEPYFVEKRHVVPSQIDKSLALRIEDVCLKFLDVIEQKNGPTHTEIKIYDGIPYIIESHTRTGGDYIKNLVQEVYDFNFHDKTLEFFSGNGPSELIVNDSKGVVAIQYLQFESGLVESISGVESVKESPGVINCELNIKVGEQCVEPQNSSQRHGYIICKGLDYNNVIENINNASKKLQVKTTSEN